MAEFFRKKNGDFKKKNKISGGNLYETQMIIDSQSEIINNNINQLNNKYNIEMSSKIKSKLDSYAIQDFYLLQYHANYFANTIKYKTNDYRLMEILPLVIRAAFINGQAGIYYDKLSNKIIPIFIGSVKRQFNGDIIEVKYISLYNVEWSADWLQNTNKTYKTISGAECENVAIFKWGTLGISAWLAFWNFVKFQNMLFRMINSSSFFVAKKGIYNVEDINVIDTEMDAFFDPDIPFFKKNSSVDLTNKFDTIENKNGAPSDLIEYYRMVIASYYSIFGRRVNQDFKNERNLVGEIQTSTSNFDILEREWQVQFYIFSKKLNYMGLNIEPLYKPENDFIKPEMPDKVEINNEQRVKNNYINNKKE